MNPLSPITLKSNTALIKRIPASFIIDQYKTGFNIDVRKYLNEIQFIDLYECLDSGILFFHPIDAMGDSEFYEQLQKIDWYYMDWKWEQKTLYSKLSKSDKILEIGSGRGGFAKKLNEDGFDITGLELNRDTVENAKKWNCNILYETVQDHSSRLNNQYDVVCSFQVMEHIPSIKDVLTASVDLLKSGGRLFVSVPNNDSFVGRDSKNILNMPPHHCTLWNEKVFYAISELFKLQLIGVYKEPLQDYHIEYYHNVNYSNIRNSFERMLYYLYKKCIFPLVKGNVGLLPGFTIMVEYRKK